MSTDYDLLLGRNCTPQSILDLLSSELNLAISANNGVEKPNVLKISVFPALRGRQATFQEAFGFSPTLEVNFRPNKFEGYMEALNLVMRATDVVLYQEDDNAILLFNGERVILSRLQGELMLDEATFKYENYAKALVGAMLPYKIQPLPQPLL